MATTQTTPPLEPPSRTSFQRMLELEKKYKFERLHTSPLPSPTTSPTAESFNLRSSPTGRHSDSLSQYQNDLMLKAVRRNVALPSLSVSIPALDGEQRSGGAREPEGAVRESRPQTARERGRDPRQESSSGVIDPEPLQKSVKFLAPESDSDNESDQSSICQSPVWEGYGQKSKEKKKEAERKRKEKERSERQARAALKKTTTRLIKPPPISLRHLPTLMERSNSAPALHSSGDLPPTKGSHLSAVQDESEPGEHTIRASRSLTPDPRDLLASRNGRHSIDTRSERGVGASWQHDNRPQAREEETQNSSQQHSPVFPDREMTYSPVSWSSMISVKHDPKPHRESRPPSASRTPQLRHAAGERQLSRNHHYLQSGQRTPGSREGSRRQPTSYSSARTSLESSHAPGTPAGRPRPLNGGYVKHHREQSTERAMAALVDDHISSSISLMNQPVERSSSQYSRRQSPSYTPEPSAYGYGPTSQPKGSSYETHEMTNEPSDYFDVQRHGNVRSATTEGNLGFTKSKGGSQGQQPPPLPVQSSGSQRRGPPSIKSIPSNSGPGRIRSLRDVAKAAFHRPTPPSSPPPSTANAPPPLAIKSRITPSIPAAPNSHPPTASNLPGVPTVPSNREAVTSAAAAAAAASQPVGVATSGVPNNNNTAVAQNQHPDSRVSEGSSSSSNYDDISPLPSPATTPDTSRPQSFKGLPVQDELPKGDLDHLTVSDDQKTLRASTEGARVSSPGRTPRRTGDAEEMTDEDRWSRTAMPMDIDFDAQSIGSNDDSPPEATFEPSPQQGRTAGGEYAPSTSNHRREPDQPGSSSFHLSQSRSNPNLEQMVRGRTQRQLPLNQHVANENNESGRPQTSPGGNQVQVQDGEKKPRQKPLKKLRKPKPGLELRSSKETVVQGGETGSHKLGYGSASGMASSTPSLLSSKADMSAIGGLVPGFASNPFFVDFSEVGKASSGPDKTSAPVKVTATQITLEREAAASGRIEVTKQPPLPPLPVDPITVTAGFESASKDPAALPASESSKPGIKPLPSPTPSSASRSTHKRKTGPPPRSLSTPTSSLKPSSSPQLAPTSPPLSPAPLSRSHVLSAIPKHLQPASSSRSVVTPPDGRAAPVAKMFVECCGCRFYHDMPAKLYECMAKPDSVVEDYNIGISGAITTMVKCPWCQHNMTTRCCAGYAAVVYVKEKLH